MNMYATKKYVTLFISGIIPGFIMIVMLMTGAGIMMSVMFMFIIAMMMMLISTLVLRHPLQQLVEGKGMLTMTLDSTGYIESFLVSPKNMPFVQGVFKGKKVETMFDRDIVQYLLPPVKARLAEATCLNAEGKVIGKRKVLVMPTEAEKNDYLFSFGTYPTFIYNKVLGVFLQKSVFSNFEQNAFVRHMVMYLCKKTEELSGAIRDFSRYIVEQIKPHKGLFSSKWIIYILIAMAVIVLIILLGPQIMQALQGTKVPAIPKTPITPG
jgi:hypothetical protein